MKLDRQMRALASGDMSAFEVIYNETKKSVYYIAYSILCDKSAAEDAMQTTYLKVIKNAASYSYGTSVKAWIAVIAKNTSLNMARDKKNTVNVDEFFDSAQLGVTHTDDYGLLIDMAHKNLPQDEFVILMLITAQGYKRREVAEIMDMPVPTVTWKYNKAQDTLKTLLSDKKVKRRGQ